MFVNMYIYIYFYVWTLLHIHVHVCTNISIRPFFLIGNNVRMLLLALSLLVGINGFDNTLLSRTLEVCTTHIALSCPI